ncbi:MAG: MaoC family dehydratase [Dehalococcoidia bacterium]|nr:MaoC family dehydratase [Dehalococcoidia bacterium]
MKKRNFEGIEVGDSRLVSKVITGQDVETFAEITGDCSPLHLDEEFAKKTVFKGRIAHGMLIAGLISAALGKFPGVVVYLWQNLSFLKPVREGDRIEASAVITVYSTAFLLITGRIPGIPRQTGQTCVLGGALA